MTEERFQLYDAQRQRKYLTAPKRAAFLAAAEHATREGWNRAYYGEDVRAVDILITGTASNPGADPLRETVADIDTTSD